MDLKTYLSQERGRQAALAKAICAHAPDLSRWADGSRPIPVPFGAPIEKATGGLVTRKEMFPDDWERIWPELAGDSLPQLPYTTPNGAKAREAKGGPRQPVDPKKELT